MAKSVRASVRVPPLSDAMFRSAKRTAKRAEAADVVAVRYDRTADTIDLTLRAGIVLRFPRARIRELAHATPLQMSKAEVQRGGDGISFRSIDVDIYVPGILADELGSLFARALGRRSRGRTTTKKAAASRANGRKGGRPRKSVAA